MIGFAILATICFVTPSFADVSFPDASAIPIGSLLDQNPSVSVPEPSMLSEMGGMGMMTIALVGVLRRKQRKSSN
jgi:hypothetical protein